MKFRKYQHIEKLGNIEVEDILIGEVHVFPKLDGTNASVWVGDDNLIKAGSRNRTLSLDKDNAGFLAWLQSDHGITLREAVGHYSTYHFYGEWLVPHTFKHYREDAWHNFWLFDIWDSETGKYLHYDELLNIADYHDLNLIQCQAIINYPTEDQLVGLMDTNTFLVQDGVGPGEGIVMKNYSFVNRFGRTTWAKMVRNEFKEDNKKAFGLRVTEGSQSVERQIVDKFVTKAFTGKERAKIANLILNEADTLDGMGTDEYLNQRHIRAKLIPRLLQTVYYELVREHLWDAVKLLKNPTINFKQLTRMCAAAVKVHEKDLF